MRRTARALDRAIDRARASAIDFASDLELARALDLDLDRVLARALDRARVGARVLVSDLDRVLARDLDLGRVFASVRDLASVLARDLASDFDRALASDLVRGIARDRVLASVLVRVLDRAHALVRALDHALACACRVAVVAGDGRPMPGRTTRGLVALAVRLLPVAVRPRYYEEFGAELGELQRGARWAYALRVVLGAWKLREALVEAVRTSDGAPARPAER